MDEKMTDTMPAEGTGYLQIRVTSAGGAFPIKDAVVTVLSDPLVNGAPSSVIRTLRTDTSGLTETVPLPAPSRTLSQSPGTVSYTHLGVGTWQPLCGVYGHD